MSVAKPVAVSCACRLFAKLTCEGVLQAVVVVQHAGHAIKAVAIKLVLIDPPAGIAEQEAYRLPVACEVIVGEGWLNLCSCISFDTAVTEKTTPVSHTGRSVNGAGDAEKTS